MSTKKLILILIILSKINYSCKFNPNKKYKDNNLFNIDNKINGNKLAFYNLENLFDFEDDPKTNDKEFTPDGQKRWTKYKFKDKINKLSKVIIALGKWNPPDLVGLCEVENKYVLEQLVNSYALKSINYQIIHQDSPDRRGIDVAMIYREDSFFVLNSEYISVSNDNNFLTRDILYVRGVLNGLDTLNIFVNHWPSRYGGKLKSEKKRIYVANKLRKRLKVLSSKHNSDYFVVMGDFNDNPDDKSLKLLNLDDFFVNLSSYPSGKQKYSYKYKNKWYRFDQIMVSKNIIDKKDIDLYYLDEKFIFIKDDKYNGYKPFRTYLAYKYMGGFSDHLPVYVTIK